MRKSPLRGYIPQGRQGKPSTQNVDGLPCGMLRRVRGLGWGPVR